MKNILTIDFDIIMGPSIDLYNHLVPNTKWYELKNIPQLNLLSFDSKIYQRLTLYLLELIKEIKFKNIHFILDHEKTTFLISSEENFNIYNIDHHHDCGYHQYDQNEPLSCANWIAKIFDINKINNYTWITNLNSKDPETDKYKINKEFIHGYNFSQIPIPDELIICLSPSWVPEEFHPLFFLWQDMVSKHFNQPVIIE